MRAARYERGGPAREVLSVGEMDAPRPGPGEVLVRLRASGINPGETKKRADWMGLGIGYPRVIPHSDGAGTIEEVGEGVSSSRVSQRVWVWGAQSGRPFGTAAQYTALPQAQAVPLPGGVGFEVGATLGIPARTAHRCVFADGSVSGKVVLVSGGAGTVGGFAVSFARWGGKSIAPLGTIAAYSSDADAEPRLPFWDLLFKNVVIRLVGSDDLPGEANRKAAADITACLEAGVLHPRIARRMPLERIAEAHEAVEGGRSDGRGILDID